MKLVLWIYLFWMAFCVAGDVLAAYAGWGVFDYRDVEGYMHVTLGYWGYHIMVRAWRKTLRETRHD